MEEQNTQLMAANQSNSDLTISTTASQYLYETGKWTKLLSIMGFIFIGFMIVVALFLGLATTAIEDNPMSNMPYGLRLLTALIYLIMGLLYLFPTLCLLKFSQKIKLALSAKNNEALNTAFSNQKSFYKFWGVLAIITVVIYVLIGLIALITFVAA